MKDHFLTFVFGLLASGIVGLFTYLFKYKHKLEVNIHWFTVAWLMLTEDKEKSPSGLPHGFLTIYCSISNSSSQLLEGKKIEVFFRKTKKENWRKLSIEVNVNPFSGISAIPGINNKLLSDPANHNLIEKPIRIRDGESLTGYLIFPFEKVSEIRESNGQNQIIKGYLKFIIQTAAGKRYKTTVKVQGTPHVTDIDYSPIP